MITINEKGSNIKNYCSKKEILKNPYYLSDPKLFQIYQKSLPPYEAYLYFPKGEEIIVFDSLKPEKSVRRIFNNIPIYDFENELLIEFKNIINSHPQNKLPEHWDDAVLLRFIHATECNLNKSYERMIKYIDWYNNIFPMEIQPEDKITQLLNLGFLYIYGRDCHFRPIIICQPSICQKYINHFDESDIIKASIFLFQFIVNELMIPGQIENWIMIINFEGSSPLNLPEVVKKLIKTLSTNFLSRLYKCYVYGMSFFLNILFKIICNFLEEVTVQKITILENNHNKLFENIRPDNIEYKFGGTAPNTSQGLENKDSLFPPRMPSNEYILEQENKNNILISKKEYIKLVEEGKIKEENISPFLREEIYKLRREKDFKKQVEYNFDMKDLKFPNEFDKKNNINHFRKCKGNNFIIEMKSFDNAKNDFHKSLNILAGKK